MMHIQVLELINDPLLYCCIEIFSELIQFCIQVVCDVIKRKGPSLCIVALMKKKQKYN